MHSCGSFFHQVCTGLGWALQTLDICNNFLKKSHFFFFEKKKMLEEKLKMSEKDKKKKMVKA